MDHNSSEMLSTYMEVDVPSLEDAPINEADTILPSSPRFKVIKYVDDTFAQIVDEIQRKPYGHPKVVLRHITAFKPAPDDTTMQLRWQVEDREITYNFPGKNRDEAWRFTCVARVLSEIYEAVKSRVTVTKRYMFLDAENDSLNIGTRDIFYRDPELFKRQATVDRYIDDIAHTCQVTRADLNVTASPKGLVAGLRSPGDASRERFELVTSPEEVETLSLSHIKWILVVEKEATLKLLTEKGLHHKDSIGQGLLVTGRGYPDLATRRFLRAVLDHTNITLFGLFDCDPDGVNILKTYRVGSKTLAQEQASNLPEMKWLGLRLADEYVSAEDDTAILALTLRDRTKAMDMLKSHEWQEGGCQGNEGRSALQQMLYLNRKMEIQVLEDRVGGAVLWLEKKITEAMRHPSCVLQQDPSRKA